MAYLDGYLYVAGGMGNKTGYLSTVERYSIAKNQWKDVSPMIYRRSGSELVELKGFLYAIGGSASKYVERYDPRTDRWEEVTTKNSYSSDFGSAVLDGRIYIVDHYSCEAYIPQEAKWEEMPAPTGKVSGRRLSVLNGKLFTTGGHLYDNSWERTTEIEYYDFEQGKWLPGKEMNVARGNHGVAVITKENSDSQ